MKFYVRPDILVHVYQKEWNFNTIQMSMPLYCEIIEYRIFFNNLAEKLKAQSRLDANLFVTYF